MRDRWTEMKLWRRVFAGQAPPRVLLTPLTLGPLLLATTVGARDA